MDLYEALKSGTSAEELEAAFRKDLNEAADRLKAETAASADEEYLNECRIALAAALTEYLYALDEEPYSIDETIKALKFYETHFKNFLSKMVPPTKDKQKNCKDQPCEENEEDDDFILLSWLKNI